jgi:hypothetical protein
MYRAIAMLFTLVPWTPHAALAQSATVPSPGTAMVPLLTPLRLSLRPSEPTAPAGTDATTLALLPLQLSLMSSVFPAMPGLLGTDCRAAAEASGNTVAGFSTLHAVMLPLGRRFTLSGFSQLGCGVDSGVGGAATLTFPLGRDLTLIGSAGLFSQPSLPNVAGNVVRPDARVDLMLNSSTKHPVSIGVDLRRQGFSVTGAW